MAIRIIVTVFAAPGKGTELAQAYKTRMPEVLQETGCEQFEVFQSIANPDKLIVLERWSDQSALDAHAKLNKTRPQIGAELRAPGGEREDYQYNRVR